MWSLGGAADHFQILHFRDQPPASSHVFQNSPDVDAEGYSIRPGERAGNILFHVNTLTELINVVWIVSQITCSTVRCGALFLMS